MLCLEYSEFTIDWWEYRLSSSKWAYGFSLATTDSEYSASLAGGNDDFTDGNIYAWATSNNISYDILNSTGNTCYSFDDIVDLRKEYLSFEKIISFKVIPLKD